MSAALLKLCLQPVCPDGWFSFQRTNGLWCYIIATPPADGFGAGGAQQYCQDNQQGSFLNGFETAAERTQFISEHVDEAICIFT